jgi:hypothetical protein
MFLITTKFFLLLILFLRAGLLIGIRAAVVRAPEAPRKAKELNLLGVELILFV